MSRLRARRPAVLVLAVAIVLFGASAVGWGVRQWSRSRNVHAAIPARPDLAGWHPAFAARLAEAETRAQGWSDAVTAMEELGALYHANGFFAEAVTCYELLIRLEPRDARWHHALASIHSMFGRLEEAEPLYAEASNLAPDYLPARLRLADVRLKANRVREAAMTYGEVLQRESSHPYALLGLARCAITEGNWREARAFLQRAIASDAEFIGGLSLMITVHEHFGETEEATRRRARVGNREFVDYADPWIDELAEEYCYDGYRLSVASAIARHAGDVPRAIRLLQRAIQLAPAVAAYRRHLGRIYHAMRNYPAAVEQLQNATRVDPGDSDSWVVLVEVYAAMGQSAASEQTLATALKACPGSAALHQMWGRRHLQKRRYPEAIAALQESKRLRPNEAVAYIDLAQAYFALGRVEAGTNELRAALTVLPGQPVALTILASHAINSGDEREARRLIAQLRQQTRASRDDLSQLERQFAAAFGVLP